MDVKSESTVGTLITNQRQSQWDKRTAERKERRHKTKLRIGRRKRGN